MATVSSPTLVSAHPLRLAWLRVTILVLLAFGLYLVTLSNNYTGGSIEFVTEIESGNWAVLLQPHKMLIHPSGWVFYQLWLFAGWQGNSLFPMQVFNALSGALAVGLMYWAALRVSGSPKTSWLVAAGFAVSCGPWLFSTEAEFVMLPLAASLLVLTWVFDAAERKSRLGHAALLGIGTGVATLLYISNILLVPVVVVNILARVRRPWRTRLMEIAVYGIAAALIVAPVYALVLVQVHGIHDLPGLLQFRLYGGQGTGTLYGKLAFSNVIYGGYALLKTLAGFPSLGLDDHALFYLTRAEWAGRLVFLAFNAVVLLVMAVPVWIGFTRRRLLWSDTLSVKAANDQARAPHRLVVIVLLVWSVLFTGFAVYWVPKDIQFWLPLLVAWWLLLALLTPAPASGGAAAPSPRQPSRRITLRPHLLIGGLVIALALINGFGVVLPHRSLANNAAYWTAMSVKDHTQSTDLIVTVVDRYIPYFTHRQTVNVLEDVLKVGSEKKAEVFDAVEQKIAATRAKGGRVFLLGIPPAQDSLWREIEVANLTYEDFARFKTRDAWSTPTGAVAEITP